MPIWITHKHTSIVCDCMTVFQDEERPEANAWKFGAYQRLENVDAPYILIEGLNRESALNLRTEVLAAISKGERSIEI